MTKIFLEFFKIDFSLLLRGKVSLFWSLLFPAIMLILQMALLSGGNSPDSLALYIVDLDRSQASLHFQHYLEKKVQQQKASRLQLSVMSQLPPQPVQAMLTIPAGFGLSLQNRTSTEMAWSGELKDGFVLAAVRGSVKAWTDAYQLENLSQGRLISISHPPEIRQQDNSPLFIITGLAGMIVLSSSLMGFGPVLVAAREAGMFQLYQLFPVNPGLILASWWLSRLLLSLCASVLMFVLAWTVYGFRIEAGCLEIFYALLLLGFGTGAFLSLGLLIATYANSVSSASVLANCAYFPLLFSGNVLVPVGNLPQTLRDFLSFLPLNTFVAVLRDVLTAHIVPEKITYCIISLSLMTLLSLFIATKYFSWNPRS
jgi:ABC-2 type transport system permease protein